MATDDAVVVDVTHLSSDGNDQRQDDEENMQQNRPDPIVRNSTVSSPVQRDSSSSLENRGGLDSPDEAAPHGGGEPEKEVTLHGQFSNPQIQGLPDNPLSIDMLRAGPLTHDDFLHHTSNNPTFNLLPPPPQSAPSSPSSIISNGSSRDPGVDSFRRFIRSRATARTRTTAESSSQRSTQSLGDEDILAFAASDELNSNSSDQHQLQQQQRRASWDAAIMHQPSESVPPIVWEESSDSDVGERRRAPVHANGGSRLRGFLPAVGRRGGRQSSSVRRHLPGPSSSSTGASMLATSPLSTTAAAVLFTSSQASVDSTNEFALSPHQRRIDTQARMPSASTLDDSALAVATSTHRSTAVDVGGVDALSISTVGNSTMARSEPAGLGDSGRQYFSTSRLEVPSRQQRTHHGAGATNPHHRDRDELGTASPNQIDPNRVARIRWVRIIQRFQLLITFVSILFSLLLFSIMISWIVLTSAYVITFEKDCDVPLKFFYWMVTLQLVLDIFRQDIMRYVLRWNPSQQPSRPTHQSIPTRVVAYNIAYLAYALLVLRLGVECVFIQGQAPDSTCKKMSPELFQSSLVFVTLTIAAWATIIFGYLVPFCVVASILTWNGYSPGDNQNNTSNMTGVFPNTFNNNAAPPGTIDQMRELNFEECGENCPQECCICMEDFGSDEAIVITDCGHILHKDCTSVWLRQARTCPVCRTDIPTAQAERDQQFGDTEQPQSSSDIAPQPDYEQQQQLRLPSPIPPVPVSVRQEGSAGPHLTFRRAGRREVATLLRAFRQQPRRDQRSATVRRNDSQDSRSQANQDQPVGAVRSTQIDIPRPGQEASQLEITTLDHPVSQQIAENGRMTDV